MESRFTIKTGSIRKSRRVVNFNFCIYGKIDVFCFVFLLYFKFRRADLKSQTSKFYKIIYMKKFVSNLIMFLIFIAYMALIIILFKNSLSKGVLILGIILALIYSMVCFFYKRIRSIMTIWWGILSLASAIWWIYLISQ